MPLSDASAPELVDRAVVDGLPVLALLPPQVRLLVVESFTRETFSFGEPIVRQGDPGDAFYVVARGAARVLATSVDGVEVPLDRFGPGDSFGETSLLDGSPRNGTVRASGDVTVLRLDRGVFDALVRLHPEVREVLALQGRVRRLGNFLRTSSSFGVLPGTTIAEMVPTLETVEVAAGAEAVRQGQSAEAVYIVEEGRLVAVREEAEGGRTTLATLLAGDVFGELDLHAGRAYHATVEAAEPSRLLRLPAHEFARLARESPEFRRRVEEQITAADARRTAPAPLPELLPAEAVDRSAAAAEELEPGASERVRPRIRTFPIVRQIDELDCGAASLAMVCRHYGRRVSLPYVRDAVGTGIDGTSLGGIRRGGERIGLRVRAVKATKERVDELPLPAIVHWSGNHWVVLYRVEDAAVWVADPARGLRRVTRAEFGDEWSGFAALPEPTERLQEAPEGTSATRWLVPFVRPFGRRLVAALVLALVAAGLEMLLPVATKIVVDDALPHRDYGLLYETLGGMLGVLVIVVAATLGQRYLLARTAVAVDRSASDYVTERLLRLPMAYFAARRAGDIERRVSGMRQVRRLLVQNGVRALTAFTQVGVALVLMLIYSWTLGLLFVAILPVYLGLMRYSTQKMRPTFEAMEEAYGRYQGRQIDAIRGIETVKSMGAEEGLRRRMMAELDRLVDRLFRADLTMMVYEGLVSVSNYVIVTVFLLVGALEVLHGSLTLGGLVAFNTLVLLAAGPLTALLALWDEAQVASVLLGRLQDVFEHEPEQGADHTGLSPVESLEGRVTLRRVGFRYRNAPDTPILSEISLDIAPGTSVALVGRSGSGKTTLVKCLAGLLEPTEGAILFDGLEARRLRYRDLRRKIGFVIQEPYLFDDTIARNIAFGEDQADPQRVVWAAEVANANEFVQRLPLGYETAVGESGLRLSGGQAQRIAIARAVYHQPPVLLFDEATSALDTESERVVKENMDKLLEGRTSFVIAHRLSTIRDADLIVVLEQGRIVETGTHEELIRRQGLYFYLHSQQLGS